METQYIGPNKVMGVSIVPEATTPQGGELVTVLYEGVPSEIMPKKTFDFLVTKESLDPTALSDRKLNKMVSEMIQIVGEWDIKMGEVTRLGGKLMDQILLNMERAENYLWTKDDTLFIPGVPTANMRTLLQAKAILNTIPTRAEEEKVAETDGGTAE